MLECSQGLERFLAGYYYLKSGCGLPTTRDPFQGRRRWPAAALLRDAAAQTMAEAVADCVGEDVSRLGEWLSGPELTFYRAEFARTGFQGGLNWYRASTSAPRTGRPSSRRGDHRCAGGVHRRRQRLGIHQTPARSPPWQSGSARTSVASTWCPRPGTGRSRAARAGARAPDSLLAG